MNGYPFLTKKKKNQVFKQILLGGKQLIFFSLKRLQNTESLTCIQLESASHNAFIANKLGIICAILPRVIIKLPRVKRLLTVRPPSRCACAKSIKRQVPSCACLTSAVDKTFNKSLFFYYFFLPIRVCADVSVSSY